MHKKYIVALLGAALLITGCTRTDSGAQDTTSGTDTTVSIPFDARESTASSLSLLESDSTPPTSADAAITESVESMPTESTQESTTSEPEVQESTPDEQEEPVQDIRFIYHENGDGSGTVFEGYAGDDATHVVVPAEIDGNTFEIVGEGAFLGKQVQSVSLPDGVVVLGAGAFQGCESLREVNFGSGLLEVKDMAFAGCDKIEKVVFPEGLQKMGTVVFYNDPALAEVHIPASVTECDNFADADTCPNLVVYTPAGSAAEAAAQAMGISVINE